MGWRGQGAVAMSDVLVVYATKHGSTQAVAEAVATTLRATGARVECQPARRVREPVTGFDLVVLGGALYNGRWHRDAHRFLKRHRDHLPAVAVFAMGPRDDEPDAWRRARSQLDRALARHAELAPTSVALFGGVDPPGKRRTRDLRDWARIEAWATEVTRHARAA